MFGNFSSRLHGVQRSRGAESCAVRLKMARNDACATGSKRSGGCAANETSRASMPNAEPSARSAAPVRQRSARGRAANYRFTPTLPIEMEGPKMNA